MYKFIDVCRFASGRLSTDREMSNFTVRFFFSYPFFFPFLLVLSSQAGFLLFKVVGKINLWCTYPFFFPFLPVLSSQAGFLLLKVVGKINLWCTYIWTVLIICSGSVDGTRTLIKHKLYGR